MHTALGPWRMRSSGAHCDRILAVEHCDQNLADEVQRLAVEHCDQNLADEVQRCTLRSGAGEEGWRDTYSHLAKGIGETLGPAKRSWRRGGGGGE